LKNYYQLLELSPNATLEEIKRTFRQQIARYHPDKVQHLGKEFQDMAVGRAADLTEAYRVLSHEGRRAEYDAVLSASGVNMTTAASPGAEAGPSAPPPAAPAASVAAPGAGAAAEPSTPPPSGAARPEPASNAKQFVQERASRDTFVRNAILDRFRTALSQSAGNAYNEAPARGFDISCVPKSKMFTRAKGPRLLGRFVARVDGASVADAWAQAGKLNLAAGEEVCVILMGTQVAPAGELATAIAEQRRRAARGGPKVTLIPVNASIWDAHMPTDAPEVAKNLLSRLRSGS
jgi:hypothetical protein